MKNEMNTMKQKYIKSESDCITKQLVIEKLCTSIGSGHYKFTCYKVVS